MYNDIFELSAIGQEITAILIVCFIFVLVLPFIFVSITDSEDTSQ